MFPHPKNLARTGDFYVKTAHLHAPIKLAPPYRYFNQSAYQTRVEICDMEIGRHYLGLLGGELCGVYDVYAETFTGECRELDSHSVASDTTRATELRVDHFARGTVASGGYEDYFVFVDDARAQDNLIIELEDLSGLNNPQSIVLYLYQDGYIPADRKTEHYADMAAKNGILSVAVSSHDLHAGNYFVTVQANTDVPVAFRLVAMLIKAELEAGKMQHGEICPNEWCVGAPRCAARHR